MNALRSRALIVSLVVALALIVAPPSIARAAPGDPDPTFDGDGIVTTGLPERRDWGNAVMLDADGRIVVAGSSLARFNPDGSLDATFGRGGVSLPRDGVFWNALVMDDLGRIIVAGEDDSDFVVARYNLDGLLDATFGGNDGIVTTDFGTDYDTAYAVTLDSTGRIIVAGDGNNNFSVACYRPDGTVDPTFGDGDGLVTIDLSKGYSEGRAVLVDDADRILIAGFVEGYESDHTALARLTRVGELDARFGDNGKLITFLSEEGDSARAVALDGAGRILVAGVSNDEQAKPGFSVARYTPDGVLDTIFGNDGQATTNGIESSSLAYAVTLDSVGRIVVAGDSAVARFTPDGALDATFDGNGVVTAEPGPEHVSLYGMAVDSADRIIVAGSQWDHVTWLNDSIVGRYNTDGALDDTFGGDGIVTANFGGASEGRAVAIDRTGRIVVVGDLPSSFGAGLTCYNPDGSLDETFGDHGKLVYPGGYLSANHLDAVAFAVANRIVVAGWSSWGRPPNFALEVKRITSTGAADPSFGYYGSATAFHSMGRPDHWPWGSAVAVDSAGRILAASSTCVEGVFGCNVAPVVTVTRLQWNGSRDTAFGDNGYATVDFDSQDNDARAMTLDSLGRIMVAGWVGPSGNRDIALIRLSPDGSPDPTFSEDGKLTADLGGDNIAAAVAIDAENRIIVAGTSSGDIAVARFKPDGALDHTFDGDGILIADLGGIEEATGVAVDGSGRIVVSGAVNGDFAALRFNPDGTPDSAFGGGDGVVTTDLGGNDVANGMGLDALGRIVVAGATDADPRQRFAVVRYQGDPVHYHRLPMILNWYGNP